MRAYLFCILSPPPSSLLPLLPPKIRKFGPLLYSRGERIEAANTKFHKSDLIPPTPLLPPPGRRNNSFVQLGRARVNG